MGDYDQLVKFAAEVNIPDALGVILFDKIRYYSATVLTKINIGATEIVISEDQLASSREPIQTSDPTMTK